VIPNAIGIGYYGTITEPLANFGSICYIDAGVDLLLGNESSVA
jgi:hypothetical protein